jgi:hypothetical protein
MEDPNQSRMDGMGDETNGSMHKSDINSFADGLNDMTPKNKSSNSKVNSNRNTLNP